MNHILMPFLDNWPMTEQAAADCLAQSIGDVSLLLIDNGSGDDARRACQRWISQANQSRVPDGLLLVRGWFHTPPLPSLSATWNRALRYVWASGADHALVVNNDVRLWRGTYEYLMRVLQRMDAYFVSATGVTQEQFEDFNQRDAPPFFTFPYPYPLPGPDFSCYLISQSCHDRFPFDENFVPAYTEDCSYHRTLMLAGEGRRIFGTGLPYYHIASGTLKSMTPEKREALERRIGQGSRAYYQRLWGGPANQERFLRPFGPEEYVGVTNPELFERVRNGLPVVPDGPLRDALCSATQDSPAAG